MNTFFESIAGIGARGIAGCLCTLDSSNAQGSSSCYYVDCCGTANYQLWQQSFSCPPPKGSTWGLCPGCPPLVKLPVGLVLLTTFHNSVEVTDLIQDMKGY